MSSDQTPSLDAFIERGVQMLRTDTHLFPSGYPPSSGDNLVVDVLAQEPPIMESSVDSPMPVIYVSYSKNPIRNMDYRGRDTVDAAGARIHFLEFYNTVIVREITKEESQKKCQQLSAIIRDVYQKNLRMKNPDAEEDFLAITNEVIAVPVVLRSKTPDVQAINIVCRPQAVSDLRT